MMIMGMAYKSSCVSVTAQAMEAALQEIDKAMSASGVNRNARCKYTSPTLRFCERLSSLSLRKTSSAKIMEISERLTFSGLEKKLPTTSSKCSNIRSSNIQPLRFFETLVEIAYGSMPEAFHQLVNGIIQHGI